MRPRDRGWEVGDIAMMWSPAHIEFQSTSLAKLAAIKLFPFLFAQTKSFLTTEKVKLSRSKTMFFHVFPAFGSINEKN